MKRYIYSVVILLALSLALFVLGCSSGGGDEDGDQDGIEGFCDNGLEFRDGQCRCVDPDCCLEDVDCPVPQTCDKSTHRCIGDFPDGDIDVDLNPDGDECEGDCDGEEDIEDDICEGDNCIPFEGDEWEDDWDEMDYDDTEDEEEEGDLPIEFECPFSTGLDAILDAGSLPCFRPLTLIEQTSSHDRNGANQDCSTTNLYLDNGENVLMDSKRPGCLYRMWFAKPNAVGGLNIKFYFNGESQPRINMAMPDFFSGLNSPLLSPLVGEINPGLNDSYYSYLPICYEEGLKVTVSSNSGSFQPDCYNLTYHTYAESSVVEEFSMDMDVAPVIDFLTESLGDDPKQEFGDRPTVSQLIPPGQSLTIFEDHSPRTINAMWLDITPANEEALNNTYLEVYYEGKETEPDIDVPIGIFFGSGFGEIDFTSLMLGMSSERYYSYYPMPYWSDILIKIRNETETSVQFEVEFDLGENDYPRAAGHFYAEYSEEIPTTDGVDYKVLKENGKGHVAGITMVMESIGTQKAFLDGDERIYIDDQSSPNLYGTGTDSYFNGTGRFSRGNFDNPLFSLWTNNGSGGTYKYNAHRLMPGDLITYDRSIKLGFEHGGENEDNANYRSVAYYYSTCLEGLSLTDAIDVRVITDEQVHRFSCQEPMATFEHDSVSGVYEGEGDTIEVVDSGRGIKGLGQLKGHCEMSVAIDPTNIGVRLARMYNHSYSNQDALIYVDGEAVGNWYNPGINRTQIFKDGFFDIPSRFTQGKSTINLKFEYAGGDQWNIYNLKVYSFLPLSGMSEGPGQVETINDPIMIGLNPCLSWSTPSGVPPKFYHIYRNIAHPIFECDDEHLVATVTETNWCDPDPLAAQTTYYYRIMAEDCTGARGPCSESLEVETGLPPFCFEAEDAYDSEYSTPDTGEVQYRGAAYSNDRVIYYSSEGGGRMVLETEIPYTGNYKVVIEGMQGPQMGTFSLRIDSVNIGNPTDLFAHEEGPTGELDFGERYLNEGIHRFLFQVAGQNPASTGYDIAIDRICLKNIEEAE